jgi:hypothetical protein
MLGYTIFVYLGVVFLYLHISLVCCFLDCAYQVLLCVLCTDFGELSRLYIFLGIECAATYRKAHVLFGI